MRAVGADPYLAFPQVRLVRLIISVFVQHGAVDILDGYVHPLPVHLRHQGLRVAALRERARIKLFKVVQVSVQHLVKGKGTAGHAEHVAAASFVHPEEEDRAGPGGHVREIGVGVIFHAYRAVLDAVAPVEHGNVIFLILCMYLPLFVSSRHGGPAAACGRERHARERILDDVGRLRQRVHGDIVEHDGRARVAYAHPEPAGAVRSVRDA